VDLKTFQNQTAKPKRLNEKLWHESVVVRSKAPSSLLRPSSEIDGEGSATDHASFGSEIYSLKNRIGQLQKIVFNECCPVGKRN
jgi:hypothetical protein